jgi:hypothetical protein
LGRKIQKIENKEKKRKFNGVSFPFSFPKLHWTALGASILRPELLIRCLPVIPIPPLGYRENLSEILRIELVEGTSTPM